MLNLVLAANPTLAMFGQIAAIVIGLFVLIFVLLAIAFNVMMSFTMAWVNEKVDLIKMLRPTVESINKASESVSQGIAPTANENAVVRKLASLPANMQVIDEKTQQSTDRVANAVIEFRARTVQVQTVVKAFLLPGLTRRRPVMPTGDVANDLKSPQACMAIEEPSPQGVESAPISAGSTQ